jgi:RNA polymerase sigma-70 factor (ECF subfamily)
MKIEFDSLNLNLDAMRAGDRQEVARLVDAAYPAIYRLALRMVDNEQDAEDVLQETFIKVMRALPGFKGRSALTTWIYRIAVNEALMLMRKRKGNMVSIEDDGDDDGEEGEGMHIVDWCCLPEAEFVSAETRQHLDRAVQQLPPRLRMVFLLRDIEGFSVAETAELMKISEANVKTRLVRARLKLREMLTVYFGERVQEKRKQ